MPLPTQSDVHVSVPLSNMSLAFLQAQSHFIADQVFPNIPSPKDSGKYYSYDRGMFNRNEMAGRAPGTESKGVGYKVTNTDNYFCDPFALHHDIPDPIRANADSVLNLDREATELLTHKALIKREVDWATDHFATSKWTTDITGAAAPTGAEVLQWNDGASEPIENIRTGKSTILESTGQEPNTLVIGYQVFNALIDHPDIVDRVKYGQTPGSPATVDVPELSRLLGVDRVLVMKAIQNTATENITNVHAFIGGKKALLCYVTPSPGIMTATAGYTFSWTGLLGASSMGGRIKKFRMEHLESDRIEIGMAYDQKLVAADLGYFFTTIVA